MDNDYYSAHLEDRSTRTGPARFLFVGRLESTKGVLSLLDAWTGITAEAELTIVGDGSLGERVRERMRRAAMPPVRLLGDLDREDLAKEYARADVFVFPSVSDPWGLVINEAMASALPMITTSAPGAVDDLVVDGSNGIIVAPFDAGELGAAMEGLARGAEIAGANGPQLLRRHPDADARGLGSRHARNRARGPGSRADRVAVCGILGAATANGELPVDAVALALGDVGTAGPEAQANRRP